MTATAKAPTTGVSKTGMAEMSLFGRPNPGDCGAYYFCRTHKTEEAVVGAAILRMLSSMTIGLSTEQRNILTSLKPDASLCVCPATGQNDLAKFCVLDADGKVIIALRAKFAGTAAMMSSFLCTGKISDAATKIPLIALYTDDSTPKNTSTRKPGSG